MAGVHISNEESPGEEDTVWLPPTEGEIRQRAYELHLERQRECGGPLDDWLEAEAELLQRRKKS